ncbi:L10-interacting MYB domain-containing protein-like [Dendrobium catenatum]|uniref:L10-interacting MYB domain-containing protein-like n=1 Tax=Dendrobium catenatum TaxID=906689 RepID=UPI0009F20B8A|nr:L10-interacting MYB domain-containing protein-like [Dendrobium catenatum]
MGKPKDGGPSATWEKDVKIIFCDLCLREIELGNRPTTHFNKEGWTNLIKNFYDKTGREYDKVQLKNKWDQLKKDWKLWKELKRGSTGLGWDPRKKTIDAPDEWWKEKLEVVPNAKKFRYCGIDPELEDKLDLMFLGVVATGDHAWTPNQGLHDENVTEDSENIDVSSESFEDPSQKLESINDCIQLKRPSSTTSTGRRKKIFGSTFLRSQITQLVNSCTNITSETNESKSILEKSSISTAIKVLEQTPEVFEDMQLYLFSTKLLEDPKFQVLNSGFWRCGRCEDAINGG